MTNPSEAELLLADKIEKSAQTRRPVEGNLKTNDLNRTGFAGGSNF